MITRGSKYFYGAAAVGLLMAFAYGMITGASNNGGISAVLSSGGLVNSIVGPLTFGYKGWVGDQIGYSILLAFAGLMAAIGGFLTAFRDGDAEALIQIQGPGTTSDNADLRVVTPQGLSYWPIVGAFSAGLIIVGLAVSGILVAVGCLGLVVVIVEWTVRAWSERATDDAAANSALRKKLMYPIEIPIAATVGALAIVFLMSRILLAVSKTGAAIVIILVAVIVFGVAVFLSSRPHLKRSVLVGALLIGAVLLLAGGIAGGISGPRESEHSGTEEGISSLTTGLTGHSGLTESTSLDHLTVEY
ncbi:unannotated protein [freshwater metagenome]|uniref:Unannotated protein n=1 Tax=freshwater metagenome TaxID=449393 RepID=A0A6J6C8G1_9ZZZZ|nr:hypothetical protein [Actinomycetota bacterium]MSY78530.1 hypothetical protein [Actinomycetota bacterium]MTA64127.1 hypothetical protein [Actinomycetota bacterium]